MKLNPLSYQNTHKERDTISVGRSGGCRSPSPSDHYSPSAGSFYPMETTSAIMNPKFDENKSKLLATIEKHKIIPNQAAFTSKNVNQKNH